MKSSLQSIPCTLPWQELTVDILGRFKMTLSGNKYIIFCWQIYRLTRGILYSKLWNSCVGPNHGGRDHNKTEEYPQPQRPEPCVSVDERSMSDIMNGKDHHNSVPLPLSDEPNVRAVTLFHCSMFSTIGISTYIWYILHTTHLLMLHANKRPSC